MFQIGQNVVYGSHGVCKIVDIEVKTIDRKKVEYYVLEPTEQKDNRYFVPTGNPAAVAKMCALLSKQELDALILSTKDSDDAWIADENQRKQRYRELIVSADRQAVIRMIHALHKHKEQQQALGRKFHLCDENFLRDAQRLLGSEFSAVLQIAPDQVQAYILKLLNA